MVNRNEIFTTAIGKLCCRFSTNFIVDRLLRDEGSRLLVFYSTSPTDEITFRTFLVYDLSKYLQRIINRQTFFEDFTNHIAWDVPGESLIDSEGTKALLGPPQKKFSSMPK